MKIMNAFWTRGATKPADASDASAPASEPPKPGDARDEDATARAADRSSSASDAAPIDVDQLRTNVIAALRTIYDPEVPVNIYDLGLIYGLDLDDGKVDIRMTLTTPGCPVAASFPQTVEQRLYEVPGVDEVRVELVWDPPWTMDRLTEDTKLQLGLL